MAEISMITNQEIQHAPISPRNHNIDAIAICITEKLGRVPPASLDTYICKVHQRLRMENEKAYEPTLLSIGPYHHSKRVSSLQCMEEYKLRYLNELTERMEIERGISKAEQLNNCLSALQELEGEARAYYAETITLDSFDFLEMMLLDGCFIIELFCRDQEAKQSDPLFKIGWIRYTLSTDLILIENQLPFFVLKKLCVTIGFPPPLLLIRNALQFIPIYSYLPCNKRHDESQIALRSIDNIYEEHKSPIIGEFKVLHKEKIEDIKHLLDLVRRFMLIEETLEVKQETNHGAKQEDTVGIVKCLFNLVHKFMLNGETQEVKQETNDGAKQEDTVGIVKNFLDLVCQCMSQESNHDRRESATELSDLGVRFKAKKEGKFNDIKFKDGILEIPIIQINDITEVIFQNLVAYEEHAHSNDVKYIIDYIAFMDGLIDSPKDVELLRHEGIIDNMMGDDEVVSTMFNRMLDNVIISSKYYYKETVSELAKYSRKRRHKWMASLKRNYLSTPWRILSIIAASILLTIALLQTVYTTLSYY